MTISVSAGSAVFGQPVSFTATVSELPPGMNTPTGGTVTFSEGGTTLGTRPLLDGVALFPIATRGAGPHAVTASYSGDGVNFAPSISSDTPGSITTIAGVGTYGYSGDNGPATSAKLGQPTNVAVDASGNVFLADYSVIREVVKATGIITTVAGNDTLYHYSGDGGPATSAALNYAGGIAVDSSGNLFIADTDNQRVREVDKATGIITTIAGNGTAGYSGDNGPATQAQLNFPEAIAVDALGNLFIADDGNNVVREVVKATGDIIRVAGNQYGNSGRYGDGGPATDAYLYGPDGLAIDRSGNLFIADNGNYEVREVLAATGTIIRITGDGMKGSGDSGDNGPAINALISGAAGLAADPSGDLFITDFRNNVIREVVEATGDIITIVGNGTPGYNGDNGPPASAELYYDSDVAADTSGNLFIADQDNNRIREVKLATSATATVTVTPAPLSIAVTPVSKVYGQPNPAFGVAYSDFVNGDTAGALGGALVFGTAATTTSNVGSYDVTAGGLTSSNYTITYVKGTLSVTPAAQEIAWASPADIIYGTPLGTAQLDATVSVVGPAPAGALTYTPAAGSVLHAGSTQDLTVVAPATQDYTEATATVTINVLKATPTVTWADPADITAGTPLGAAQLDATASVPGVFTYSPAAGALLNAGSNQPLAVTFTPYDMTDYTSATATILINVNPSIIHMTTPTITWADPADITAGTPLGAAQLDATASVPGVFTYSPAAGTILSVGDGQRLSVTFIPNDATRYTTATGSAIIGVISPATILTPTPIPSPTATPTPSQGPTPTSQSPMPPQPTGIATSSHTRKGLTAVTLTFSEALNPASASNSSLFTVLGAVKKHGKTVFSKHVGVQAVTYEDSARTVMIHLAKPYKGAVQVTVHVGLMAANGASSSGDVTAVVP